MKSTNITPYVQNQNATLPFFGEVSEWKISGDKGYMSEDDEIQAENDVLKQERTTVLLIKLFIV